MLTPTPRLPLLDAEALGWLLLDDVEVRAGLEALRTELGQALAECGFQLLITRPLQATKVSSWVRLSAETLVRERERGHVLAVRLVWAADTRQGQVGASVLWVEAAAHERDDDARSAEAFASQTLGTTAGLAMLQPVEAARATLLARLRTLQARPIAGFVDTLVGEALAP